MDSPSKSDRLAGWRAQRLGEVGQSHELASFPASPTANGGGASDLSEITAISDQIKTYQRLTEQIAGLHSRSLEHTSDEAVQQDNAQLAQLTGEASDLQAQIQRSIQSLSRARSGSMPSSIIPHANRVRENFAVAILNYQTAMREYRQRYAQHVERQFRIVKPDATPEEVRAVLDEPEAGTRIFTRAVASSNQYHKARAAYLDVQGRHDELQRIAAGIAELGKLYNDMAILIEAQQETIENNENVAKDADRELEAGVEHAEKAADSARKARQKRIWCFWLCVLILIAIAAAIGIPLGLKNHH